MGERVRRLDSLLARVALRRRLERETHEREARIDREDREADALMEAAHRRPLPFNPERSHDPLLEEFRRLQDRAHNEYRDVAFNEFCWLPQLFSDEQREREEVETGGAVCPDRWQWMWTSYGADNDGCGWGLRPSLRGGLRVPVRFTLWAHLSRVNPDCRPLFIIAPAAPSESSPSGPSPDPLAGPERTE